MGLPLEKWSVVHVGQPHLRFPISYYLRLQKFVGMLRPGVKSRGHRWDGKWPRLFENLDCVLIGRGLEGHWSETRPNESKGMELYMFHKNMLHWQDGANCWLQLLVDCFVYYIALDTWIFLLKREIRHLAHWVHSSQWKLNILIRVL